MNVEHISDLFYTYKEYLQLFEDQGYYIEGTARNKTLNDKLLELRSLITRIAGFHGKIVDLNRNKKDRSWEIKFTSYSAPIRHRVLCPVATMTILFSETSGLSVLHCRERGAAGVVTECNDEVEEANKRCKEINAKLV